MTSREKSPQEVLRSGLSATCETLCCFLVSRGACLPRLPQAREAKNSRESRYSSSVALSLGKQIDTVGSGTQDPTERDILASVDLHPFPLLDAYCQTR
ncbi:hypothetical protein BC938DRAFT_477218 [Jimgerdemannia flammicorona]|uniref:Uncharacterized protein n=1 Tax=Jimgerdemannia flammicorona TaxID=994334 RepID=A0A433QPP1_9FUNG|nr:hypothetical protein BC938DRAFT_477218 [Jimgerdemannia flammicorona]